VLSFISTPSHFKHPAPLVSCSADPSPSLYLPNPIYHQIAFAIILISGIIRNIILMRRYPPNHPAISHVTKAMAWGVAIFAAGFGLWNIDNVFCSHLREVREYIGWLGFLLEGEWASLYLVRKY